MRSRKEVLNFNMENVSEFFYEKLKDSKNPGVVLAQFYAEILERESGRSEIIMLNKLIKVFGRNSVFFAIMNLINVQNLGEGFPYGLIFTICKSSLERKSNTEVDIAISKNLSKDVEKIREAIDKTKSVTVSDKLYKELE